MQVTKDGIERIKQANALAEVVAERGIAIEKKGRTLVASCPFHEEKTPSFVITPSKGLFHCFGCGVSGDVIGFVTKFDGVTFGGALNSLAQRAGLTVSNLMKANGSSSRSASRPKLVSSPPPPPEVLAKVVEHYHKILCSRPDAQEYLKKRGLTEPSLIRDYQIGYADGSLLKRIPKSGELKEQLLSLGSWQK